jgi:F-type H+-transporting ATPase subunit a
MLAESHAAAEHAEQSDHAVSIFYAPVNWLWDQIGPAIGLGDVDVPDHVVMSLVVLGIISALVIPVRLRLSKENPGTLQQLLETVVQALANMIDDVVGEGSARKYLPFIGAFAFFIFVANFTGQFFFLQPPTQTIWVTLALAVISWVFYHAVGIREHGLGYLKQFLGPVPWLIPLMLPIELISLFARVLSLSIRLYGNIFGEHLAVGIFFGLVPFLLPLPLMALGLLAAFIQTFIFIILSTLYIAGAEAEAH